MLHALLPIIEKPIGGVPLCSLRYYGRSVVNVLVNLFGDLLAYCHQPKTPTLSLTTLPAVSLPEPERML